MSTTRPAYDDNVGHTTGGYRVYGLHDAHVLAEHPAYGASMAGALVVEFISGRGHRVSHSSFEADLDAARSYIADRVAESCYEFSYDNRPTIDPQDIELIPITEGDLPAYAGAGWQAHLRGYDPAEAIEKARRAGEARDQAMRDR